MNDEAGGLYMQYLIHAGPNCLIVLYERYSINWMMAVKACNNSTAVVFYRLHCNNCCYVRNFFKFITGD